jgi:hypothetical protein
MCDDDDRKSKVVDQPPHQIEQPRLYRNIETAGRLIHEHKPRLGHKITRDLKPLPHPARVCLRRVVDPVGRNLYPLQP